MKIVMPIMKLAIILGCFIIGEVSAFTHIVGGSHGWRVPKNLSFYQDWAKPRTFGVGDKLVFPSRPMGNNVVMVSKDDFEPCTETKVEGVFYEGPLILTLNRTRDYYFFNGIGKHCEAGQKLHIIVGDKEGSSGDETPFELFAENATSLSAGPIPSHEIKKHSSAPAAIGGFSIIGLSFIISLFQLII